MHIATLKYFIIFNDTIKGAPKSDHEKQQHNHELKTECVFIISYAEEKKHLKFFMIFL